MSTTTFITATDLDTFMGEDYDRIGASLTPERKQQAIDDANSEASMYVGAKTLASIPPALKRHTCAIARYAIYKDASTEKISEEYKNALTFLKNVASGVLLLPVVQDPQLPETTGVGVFFTAKPNRFDGTAY